MLKLEDGNLTREEVIEISKKTNMIPVTYDRMFKGVFMFNLEILKIFLIEVLELNLNPDEVIINPENGELPLEKYKEKLNIIDMYVTLNKDIHIDVEMNNKNFTSVMDARMHLYGSKLYTLLFERGDEEETFDNKILIQLDLNAKNNGIPYGEDVIVNYGTKTKQVYVKNVKRVIKYLAYYRNLYYNKNEKLNKSQLWLVALSSENFVELYDILVQLLKPKEVDKFIRKVINMSKDNFMLHEWEKEKMDQLKQRETIESIKIDIAEENFKLGVRQGIEQGTETRDMQIVKAMLDNNYKDEDIVSITGLSLEKINEIKKNK